MPRYREEVVTKYKAFMGFRKGLERLGVILYKFGYLIALSRFKTQYLELELKEDL